MCAADGLLPVLLRKGEYEPTNSSVTRLSALNTLDFLHVVMLKRSLILVGVLPSQDWAYRDNAISQSELLCYRLSRTCPTVSMATFNLWQ